jgi:hypothetical protein
VAHSAEPLLAGGAGAAAHHHGDEFAAVKPWLGAIVEPTW